MVEHDMTNHPTFRIGDKVFLRVNDLITGTVVEVLPASYKVKFHNPNLLPQIMEFIETDLHFYFDSQLAETKINIPDSKGHLNVNTKTHCPQCGDVWKETAIGFDLYYDCISCNIKKEDVVDE
jgi:hypothetical protein